MRSPDPITEPKAYQDHLIGLVGDDDPSEVQAESARRIRELLADAGDAAGERPADGEWSVLECVAHIVDAEIVAAARYRWILAHDAPDLIGYDQDLWVDRLHDPVEDGAVLLELFEPLRNADLELWKRTPVKHRDRVGIHRERGPESFGLLFTMIAGHDRFHLAQAQRALAMLRTAH
ncbi:MAG TPA: DinB family protein [Candidatus Limnocylindrales bacterium]|nr:DinB family protein [Candidatus Limnocylindrales bacterium]